jgi:uncharacterized membrane protein
MSRLFLYFLIYSFLGYCLEKLFARATRSDRQVRKCFLLLPLCPVYGLAMTAVINLSPLAEHFLSLALLGGIFCTAAEYLVHFFYEEVFHVRFWDYSGLRGNVKGRICPQFSLAWGILSAVAARFLHPAVAILSGIISPAAVFFLWMAFAVDCVLTAFLLRRTRDTEQLALTAILLSSGSPASPGHRGRRTDGSSH